MRIQSSSLSHDVLQRVVQPFIKSDDTGRLLVHGVKHLLPGFLLVLLGLVEIAVLGSEPVSPRQSSGSIHQLGEGFLAYQTIIVGVGFGEHLEQAVVQLRVAVALLVRYGLLHPPDEVLLGLIEGADGAGAAGHRDGLGAWFLLVWIELGLNQMGRIPSFYMIPHVILPGLACLVRLSSCRGVQLYSMLRKYY